MYLVPYQMAVFGVFDGNLLTFSLLSAKLLSPYLPVLEKYLPMALRESIRP